LEDTRDNGNAVFSSFPITDSGFIKFAAQCGYGNRMALWVDFAFKNQNMRAYSAHLESGKGTDFCMQTRNKQWNELKSHSSNVRNVIIGGDFNWKLFSNLNRKIYSWDIKGFQDTHLDYVGNRLKKNFLIFNL
jgi:endonuclease/exonuclease/phosphatase family metal-dependent hydrolase